MFWCWNFCTFKISWAGPLLVIEYICTVVLLLWHHWSRLLISHQEDVKWQLASKSLPYRSVWTSGNVPLTDELSQALKATNLLLATSASHIRCSSAACWCLVIWMHADHAKGEKKGRHNFTWVICRRLPFPPSMLLLTHPPPSVHPKHGTIWRTATIRCAHTPPPSLSLHLTR